MRILIYISFLVFFGTVGNLAAQEYRTHKVEKGETVYSISKRYAVPEETIYRLNPDARNGISDSNILILPAELNGSATQEKVSFKKHRVKRKETLFGIAQLYNISVEDIKKYNKDLYSRQLKKGEKIQIPVYELLAINGDNAIGNNSETVSSEWGTHTVQPKETKFGIARMYGISLAELEALNPTVGENLPIGILLKVPAQPVTDSATIEEEEFQFYEVQPKEGFFRLKVKLGLSQEELVALNPFAKDGLKEGMILKVPISAKNTSQGDEVIVNLEDRIINFQKKRIAVMLPFQLNKANSDSLQGDIDLLRENGALRVALDFYSGVLMAAEFAKEKGISVQLDIYDTEGSVSKVSSIINQNNFENVDAVIGPLLQKNVERAALDLKGTDTPIFSPLSNREIKSSSNIFQTLPTDDMMQKAMLDYLRDNSLDKNIIIISDAKKAAQKARLLAVLPGAKTIAPREKGFLYVTDVSDIMSEIYDNWVILESDNPIIVSNVVGLLNGMPEKYKIRLFTLDKNDAYNYHDVSNLHLSKLSFTFPSVNKSYDFNDKDAFVVSYKNKYAVLPNRFAVRGFDVTYDVLLRLASANDVYDANDSAMETEYIENKFRYTKQMFSGYQNNAFYLIKYNKDLHFEVVR